MAIKRYGALALGLVLALWAGPARAEHPLTALAPFETYADGFADRTRAVVAVGLERPIGLAIDAAGLLLIAEERAARVVRVQPNGSRTPVVRGIEQPRWLAVHEDGTLYVSARRLTRHTDHEADDESDESELILALSPSGALHVFADGFKQLQWSPVNPAESRLAFPEELAASKYTLKHATPQSAMPRADDPFGGDVTTVLVEFSPARVRPPYAGDLSTEFALLAPELLYNINDTQFYTLQLEQTALPLPLEPGPTGPQPTADFHVIIVKP